MVGAVASFSAMAIAGRELGKTIPTFEIMMYRSIIGFFIVVAIGQYSGTLNGIKFTHTLSHIGRNIAHFTGQNLWFFAVTVAPLAQVIALEFTFPLWVILLSPIFLGEKLTKLRVITAVLGFLGGTYNYSTVVARIKLRDYCCSPISRRFCWFCDFYKTLN
jgi:drug/metabolite transporter (DMT)-like permease